MKRSKKIKRVDCKGVDIDAARRAPDNKLHWVEQVDADCWTANAFDGVYCVTCNNWGAIVMWSLWPFCQSHRLIADQNKMTLEQAMACAQDDFDRIMGQTTEDRKKPIDKLALMMNPKLSDADHRI